MMAVTVSGAAALQLGRPTAVFTLRGGFSVLTPMRGFELHPDGRRFIVARRPEPDPLPPITRLHVVHNWFTELERLSPTGR